MIVNSQPYKPDQRLQQQQRCVGINQTQHENTTTDQLMSRINAAHQQQNSLYGAHVTTTANSNSNNQANIMPQPNQRSSHLFDLANLQHHQQHQASLFDSAYDDVTSSLATANQNGSDQNSHNNLMSDVLRAQHQHQHPASMASHKQQQQQHQQDVSLYSPSSSTSLLYHVYDQINLPNDQQQANQNNFKRSNTTILNPANLFNSTVVNTGGNQLTLPHHHQQQQQQQQQNFGQFKTTTIPQQELYSSGAQFHLHQPSFNSDTLHQQQQQSQHNNYTPDNHQLMLDTILRQQHAATTRAQHYHNRPLSSSGASSMSGQSMALTYGRQPRATSQLPSVPAPALPLPANKSLASVLQSNQTLNHLGLANGLLAPSSLDSRGPKKLPYESATGAGAMGLPSSRKWKRAQQRARHFVYVNGALLKCCLLLVLLAVFSLSIIKFASFNQAPNQNQQQQQQQLQPFLVPPFLDPSSNIAASNQKPVSSFSSTQPKLNLEPNFETSNEPDMHKSKLLIGEFVVRSQNYSNSEAQRALLAENIVKLMDQVFLSTEVRRVYSRMEIKNIRPHSSGAGIVVDCNIILNESIAYAAQQFGMSLYHSLTQSAEKLANQANYIIDRNSIRFNTVPDKDLAMVPAELIPPTLVKDAPKPPSWPLDKSSEAVQVSRPSETTENSVVWSTWSLWSSCVDKNGACDPTRLHSRLRRCVAQHTGETVDALQCKQRFSMQDQVLEVDNCAATCAAVTGDVHVMSDAPSDTNGPYTAPSLVVAEPSQPPFLLPGGLSTRVKPSRPMDQADDLYSPSSQPSVSTSPSANGELHTLSEQPAPQLPQLGAEQQQMSCSNCTLDEICLVEQKVPFCAKTKDRADPSGCGGWCQPETQLCQRVGNAFKCINDECVAGEWRCHDSLCIPLSKRCDGHSNCYDSSDERDCPNR